MRRATPQTGLSLIELLVAMALSALLLAGFGELFRTALTTQVDIEREQVLLRDARFAMNRMVDAVQGTQRLILPLADRSSTTQTEHLREQWFDVASGTSSGSALLAVAASATQDLNLDGIPDADNDADGRIDEDWGADMTNDGANGLLGFDDDGDGQVDEHSAWVSSSDDDEYLNYPDEDPFNGRDDDGDGSVDEDVGADMNNDRAPGVAGVDDDGDGSIDEGDDDDDDEDGLIDEDWLDPVVFYLLAGRLMEARPAPHDANRDNVVDGQDRVTSVIATDVTHLRFERLSTNPPLIDIQLTLERDGHDVTLHTRVRAGAAL